MIGASGYLAGRIKEWVKNQKVKTNTGIQKTDVTRSIVLESALAEIRSAFGADRIIVAQFKNGEYFATGESVQKLITTHCVCRAGITFPILSSQSEQISKSLISPLLRDLYDRKEASYVVAKLPENFYLKQFWMQSGTAFVKVRGIFNPSLNMVGVLYITYVNANYEPYIDVSMQSAAEQVGANLLE